MSVTDIDKDIPIAAEMIEIEMIGHCRERFSY